MFDPNIFTALQSNPAAAAAYLAANPPAPQPAATPQPAAQAQPQTAQPVPTARGSLSDAYTQGARAVGHGPAAKFAVVGSVIEGYIARDMLDTDVIQETDFATKQPKFNRDGSPMWQLLLPVNVAVTPEFPEGKVTVWAKGRLLKSITREQSAKGYQPGEGLAAGDYIRIQRTQDSPTNFGSPAKEYDVQITRNGQQVAAAPVPPTPAVALPPVTQTAPVTPAVPTASAPPAPTPAPSPAPAIPGLTPEQALLVAQYTGQSA
jgi:hypothetical protein